MAEDKSGKKMIAVNREVRHEYFVVNQPAHEKRALLRYR